MDIRERLVKYRRQVKVRQGDIAKSMGVTQASLSRWERGKSDMSAAKVVKYADYLGVDIKLILR